MSELSKKYADPKNFDNFLFFTRNIEFSKIVIYQNGRIIQTITSVEDLRHGITFKNDADQEIYVRLLNKGDFNLYVTVNDDAYIPLKDKPISKVEEKIIKMKESNVRPLSIVFLVVLVIQLIDFVFLSENNSLLFHQMMLQRAFAIYYMDIIVLLIVCYAVTTYFLDDNRGWAFFLGFPVLLIYTGLEIYDYYILCFTWSFDFPWVIWISIFLKIVACLILLFNFRRVLTNLKSKDLKETSSDTVLDGA